MKCKRILKKKHPGLEKKHFRHILFTAKSPNEHSVPAAANAEPDGGPVQ
jgi:hypothetical protein